MSDKLGPLTFGKQEEQIFLGREIAKHRDYSEATAKTIDAEVTRIVMDGYNEARRIVEGNRDILTSIAEALLEREVLDGEQIAALARGETLPAPSPPSMPDSAQPQPADDAEASKAEETPGLPQPGNQPA
jgi:cell division protease FtsH